MQRHVTLSSVNCVLSANCLNGPSGPEPCQQIKAIKDAQMLVHMSGTFGTLNALLEHHALRPLQMRLLQAIMLLNPIDETAAQSQLKPPAEPSHRLPTVQKAEALSPSASARISFDGAQLRLKLNVET